MNLVQGAVGSLIPKLLQLLGNEYKLQKGVKKNVQSLSQELKSAHAFLSKVSDVPWDQLDEQVKEWASDIREASYDMEDVLDTFLVQVDGREPTGRSRLKRAMNKMASLFGKGKARHDVGCAISDIMKQLQEVAERRARYKIDDVVNSAATTSTLDPRLKAMYREVATMVGLEGPSKDLMSKLSVQGDDMARQKKIVSIVGFGGLGKTTLAKAVYDKLRVDFQCDAFVSVGRSPNLRKVLMDILYELDKRTYANIHTKNRDERQLIDELREFLMNKRYLIVIDDIWENKSWEETIELAPHENNCGSRIIITTRNHEVAKEIGDEVYKIQPLSDDNSKKLFYVRIFGHEGECLDNDQSHETSNKILKKCDGVPLAIITMASLLVGKPREKWSDVFTSIGFGHNNNNQVQNTMKILSYSYYDMPSYLRICMLYLSVFPEDYTIHKTSLIWKWIAEGFIQEIQGIGLFELGERYFNDLINRSMIQSIELSEDEYMVERCHVHDMVLDLIRSMSDRENYVTILDNDEGAILKSSRARRLAHQNNAMEPAAHDNVAGMSKVRSFIACKCAFDKWDPLSRFKLIRVLALEQCRNVTPRHLIHLKNLLHLRYLGLRKTSIKELPIEIGALMFLQTLDLEGTGIRVLTPSISQLTQLMCLNCDLDYYLAADWIGKLTSLVELQIILQCSEDGHTKSFIKELGNLRELRVFKSLFPEMDGSMERDLVLSLRNLHKLQVLELNEGDFAIDADTAMWGEAGFVLPRHLRVLDLSSVRFSLLPSCISAACLPNLTHLSLIMANMDEKDLEFLGRLPELYYLYLQMKSSVILCNINTGKGYFQKLRFCHILGSMILFQCRDDESSFFFHIWNGRNAMPFGSSINNCSVPPSDVMPNLEALEFNLFVRALKDGNGECGSIGLEYLTSLKEVEVNIICNRASAMEVDEAEATLRNAIEGHPNHPTLKVSHFA